MMLSFRYYLFLLITGVSMVSPSANAVPFTILHTNDLHSHLRPERSVLNLGGVARIKTLVSRLKASSPNPLLLDGGDWSEGAVYYNLESGSRTLKLMEVIGYDGVVVGNHEMLNGPDVFLDSYQAANTSVKFLGVNFRFDDYPRKEEMEKVILPYFIKEADGVRVAVIGLTTFELIWDRYFNPVKVTSPFNDLQDLVKKLLPEVDAFIAVSHNQTALNEKILKAIPEISLIVGGHDHQKHVKPVVVERKPFAPGWVVETGARGHHLGKVDLKIESKSRVSARGLYVELLDYNLIPISRDIPEDQGINREIEKIEAELEARHGPIFHDHIADSHCEITLDPDENLLGVMSSDAYRIQTGSDIGMEYWSFLYDSLPKGPIHSADIWSALNGVHNSKTGKSWPVGLFTMKGKTLKSIASLFYAMGADKVKAAFGGSLSFSGLKILYNPAFKTTDVSRPTSLLELFKPSKKTVIEEFWVGDKKLRLSKSYKVAASRGLMETLEFLNSLIPTFFPFKNFKNYHKESWRVVADRAASLSPITKDDLNYGDSVKSIQPDLMVPLNDFDLSEDGNSVSVLVSNIGASSANAGNFTIKLFINPIAAQTGKEPVWIRVGDAKAIPEISNGSSAKILWDGISVPNDNGLSHLKVFIEDSGNLEVDHANNLKEKWFRN